MRTRFVLSILHHFEAIIVISTNGWRYAEDLGGIIFCNSYM
jgi:hypothetical protein